jgi:hypothetical protein
MRLAMILHLITLAATVVIRRPPGSASGRSRTARSGAVRQLLITEVVFCPRRDLSPLARPCIDDFRARWILDGCCCPGSTPRLFQRHGRGAPAPDSQLYSVIRHPLYLSEEIATIGSVIPFLTSWTAILMVVQMAYQVRRMRNGRLS